MIYKLNRLLGVAVLAAALAATTGIASAQEVTLKLHHFLPIQANIPQNILEPWAERIQEATANRVKIDRFYGMALGGAPPQLMDQALDGVADIVCTVIGYTPGRFPRSEAFELPFMMSNAGATSAAFWEYAENNMMNTDFADYKILALWVHGPGIIHSTEPITSPDDLVGVKVRAPTRVTNQMFTSLGATAVGMPVPAVPEALSKGVIDATVIPWEVTGALKVPELVANHTEFGDASLYTATFVLAMNREVWDGLPADLQALIMAESGAGMSAVGGAQMQRDDAPGRAAAVEQGNNIITLADDQVQQWRDAAAGVEAAWVADMHSKGIDGAALAQEARDLIAKHTAMQ